MIFGANLARYRAYLTLLTLLPLFVFAAPVHPVSLKTHVPGSLQALNAGDKSVTHQQVLHPSELSLIPNAPDVRLALPPGHVSHMLFTQDLFAISPRGFNGEHPLNANHSGFINNNIPRSMPLPVQQRSLRVDYGERDNNGMQYLAGTSLDSGTIGIHGSVLKTGDDLFSMVRFSGPGVSKPALCHSVLTSTCSTGAGMQFRP